MSYLLRRGSSSAGSSSVRRGSSGAGTSVVRNDRSGASMSLARSGSGSALARIDKCGAGSHLARSGRCSAGASVVGLPRSWSLQVLAGVTSHRLLQLLQLLRHVPTSPGLNTPAAHQRITPLETAHHRPHPLRAGRRPVLGTVRDRDTPHVHIPAILSTVHKVKGGTGSGKRKKRGETAPGAQHLAVTRSGGPVDVTVLLFQRRGPSAPLCRYGLRPGQHSGVYNKGDVTSELACTGPAGD